MNYDNYYDIVEAVKNLWETQVNKFIEENNLEEIADSIIDIWKEN